MKNKLPIVILVLILDLSILPILLFILTKIIENRDLFMGVMDTFKIIKSNPQIIYSSFLFSEGYRKLWLILQPLVGLFFILVYFQEEKGGNNFPESAGDGEYGTSRFLTNKEVDKKFTVYSYPGLINKGGVVLGSKSQRNLYKFWLDADDTQTLLIGSTGSGKTLRVIMPSIWVMAQAGESMVLTDPKGELYEKTSGFLENQGYEIVMLDFRNLRNSKNRWNPLQPVIDAVAITDNSLASERAWDIANMLVHQRPIGNTDPIWSDGEESTIASLILANCLEAEKTEERNMASVYSMLYMLGRPNPDDDNEIPLNIYINELLPEGHPAQAAFGTAGLAPYRTRASFFTGAASKLKLWADPSIAYITSWQDHELANIGRKKTAVFLIIPDEKNTTQFLASLYIDQVYQALVEEANRDKGRLPIRVNFLLDEFGNLPKIKDFDKKITVARSRNIRFLLAIQGLDQIKANYRDTANIITGNCRTWIYLLTADNDTARVLSQKVGQYTIRTKSYSSSKRSYDVSEGSNLGLTGRALLMPDEILRWNVLYHQKALVIKAGDYPAILNTPFLSDTPIDNYFKRFTSMPKEEDKAIEFDHKKIIWVPQIKRTSNFKEIERRGKREISLEDELDIL